MAGFEHRQRLDSFAFADGIGALHVTGASGAPILYAATLSGGGITAFAPIAGGGLTALGSLGYLSPLAAGIAPAMAPFAINGTGTLLVSGVTGQALVAGANGAPLSWITYAPAPGAPAALAAAGAGYLLVSSSAGGLSAYAAAAGGPEVRSTLDLPAVSGLVQSGDGGLHAISATADTITRLTLDAEGRLSAGQVAGASDGLGWDAPSAVRSVQAGDTEYLVVAGAGSSSLTTLTFADGVYRITDHVIDDLTTRFATPSALDTIAVNGRALVAAGGGDDGITIFELLPDGRLVHLQTFEDTAGRSLDAVSALAFLRSGTQLQLVAAGQGDAGVSVFWRSLASLSAPLVGTAFGDNLVGGANDDLLIGGAGDDILSGGAGDDILYDGEGSDTLRGGSGADVFVFSNDGAFDRVSDFEPGIDRLDFSAFPNLYSVASLGILSTATGAVITFGDEVVEVRSAYGGPLDASHFTEAAILGLTRPPLVPIGRDLTGTAAGDVLLGAEGADRIGGGGGDDRIDGFGGPDLLSGGTGNDRIDGGAGRDATGGGAGNDTLSGGTEADFLLGGPGNDRMEGGEGADVLHGGSGRDVLIGGAGPDTLYGGPGADVFVFALGDGMDRVADFDLAADLIDLSARAISAGFGTIQTAISSAAGGTMIDFGGGDRLLLTGIDPDDLTAAHFLF